VHVQCDSYPPGFDHGHLRPSSFLTEISFPGVEQVPAHVSLRAVRLWNFLVVYVAAPFERTSTPGIVAQNKAQETARLLESLNENDLGFVLDQLQTTVRYIKSQRES